jgi:hypothetical protein
VFRNWFEKKPAPLSGAPAVRRLKSYSAQSGYVYQYAFEGQRPLAKPAGTEFVFSASADRKTWHDVSVLVEAAAVNAWQQAHGRALSSTEWYALAKMALFGAFDERATPAEIYAEPVRLRAADVEGIMERLGLA